MTDKDPKSPGVELNGDWVELARIVALLQAERQMEMLADVLQPAIAAMERDRSLSGSTKSDK
jgi:hypothetical protein